MDCVWDNVAENSLVIDDIDTPSEFADLDEPCGYMAGTTSFIECYPGYKCLDVEDQMGGYTQLCKEDTMPQQECFDINVIDNNDVFDSQGNTCSFYNTAMDMCGNYDTDIFFAYSNCCACGGGRKEIHDRHVEEYCGWMEDTGIDVMCAEGLECKDVEETAGLIVQKCAPPTNYYGGIVVNTESETVAFWYIDTNESETSGWFVKRDGTSGGWSNDEGTTDSGTW